MGPRTAEGKARAARNGFKGRHRPQLRELVRVLSEAMREQRNCLVSVRASVPKSP
jgi:hypothetical protein